MSWSGDEPVGSVQDVGTATFGATLRAWRARRGLSQEALADAAGTVARHVSRLETGRAQPSAAMVRALGAALDVPPRPLDELLAAAGHAPRPTSGAVTVPGPRLLVEMRRLLDAHEPWPALALDGQWDVVAHNTAAGTLMAYLDPAALEGRNALRVALHPGGLVQWSAPDAPWVVALRARAADQAARVPAGRLSRVLAEVGGPADTPAEVSVPMHLHVPAGEMTLLAVGTRLAAPGDAAAADLTVDTLLPADPASREVLRRTLAEAPRPSVPGVGGDAGVGRADHVLQDPDVDVVESFEVEARRAGGVRPQA